MLGKLLASILAKDTGDPGAPPRALAARRAIDAYVASHPVRKLHLGAGPGSPAGWLATDVAPASAAVVYLDAAQAFPIPDRTFDYVFSEHMIEHMPWAAGQSMLRECARILKPGGTLRIATPDLAVLLGVYRADPGSAGDRYARWIAERALPEAHAYPDKAVFVINSAFRNWGHQFLYDTPLLQTALREAGFGAVRRCAYGESADSNLRGIESHGHNVGAPDIAAFETMVFEAARPQSRT